jgi:signal transduction histidine kinase
VLLLELIHLHAELLKAREAERHSSQASLAQQAERLRIVHEIDLAIISEVKPEAIAAAVLQPMRRLLGVARVNINLIDEAAGDVEWFASAGRQRTHIGSGLRFPAHLIGDINALKRGEPQKIDTRAQPGGQERDALLASGVYHYMAIPMVAAGELIGAVSFGGEEDSFPEEQVIIAREVATQLAVAIGNARLYEKVHELNAELEQRVRERTAELQSANRELESFSYSVSHDLRAPLRAVDGYALMLEEDYGARLDDEGRRLLGVVRGSAAQMGRLIDDLLGLSQVGRKALVRAPVDMRSLAGEVVAELAEAYPNARIDLGTLPAAAGDRALLRHVWTNLIGNGLKYSSRIDAPRVEISGQAEGEESIYQVRDNGAGFDMRYYDKLFGVFQRLHREDEFEGTGVGLAIVQRVIVRHGGRIWGESAPGQGACFHFALPKGA